MVKYEKIVKWILGLQGIYYSLAGLWALISLESFERFVRHFHEGLPFEMHSIAAMSLILGIFFILATEDLKKNILVVGLASGIALSVFIIEVIYLPSMPWNLFWLDMTEEFIVFLVLGTYFIKNFNLEEWIKK